MAATPTTTTTTARTRRPRPDRFRSRFGWRDGGFAGGPSRPGSRRAAGFWSTAVLRSCQIRLNCFLTQRHRDTENRLAFTRRPRCSLFPRRVYHRHIRVNGCTRVPLNPPSPFPQAPAPGPQTSISHTEPARGSREASAPYLLERSPGATYHRVSRHLGRTAIVPVHGCKNLASRSRGAGTTARSPLLCRARRNPCGRSNRERFRVNGTGHARA